MIFPLPHLVNGPPSAFALKVRPYFIALLTVQALLCVARFWILDFWGAMILVLVTLVGSFVVSGECGIDITYCAYYGIMAFVCGVFDVILCVERSARSPWPLFYHKAPLMYNMASAVYLVSPVVEMVSAYVAYLLFKDGEEWEAQTGLPVMYGDLHGYGAAQTLPPRVGQAPRAGANSERGDPAEEPQNAPRRPPPPSFTPFQGTQHRLEA